MHRVETFIRRVEPGELKLFGGGEIVNAQTGEYPYTWGRFKSRAWRELKAIRRASEFSGRNLATVNGLLAELTRRGKTSVHPLVINATRLRDEGWPNHSVKYPGSVNGKVQAIERIEEIPEFSKVGS